MAQDVLERVEANRERMRRNGIDQNDVTEVKWTRLNGSVRDVTGRIRIGCDGLGNGEKG